MRNFILAVVVAVLALTGSRGQDHLALIKSWEEMRRGVTGVECKYTLTTTQFKRKSLATGQDLYPADVKTDLEIDVRFNFARQEYQFTQVGKTFRVRDRQVVDYSDSTTLKAGKIYGYLAPPAGQPSGVGKSSGSASDLAIIEGGLESHLIPDTILPCLYPVGVIPLSPVQNISSATWHRYRPSEYADLLMASQPRGFFKVAVRQNEVFEAVFEVDADNRVKSVSINRDGKKLSMLRFDYAAKTSSKLAGWTRNVYLANKLVTTQEAKIAQYRVLSDTDAEREITPPAITAGLIVAKIPTLDPSNGTDQGKPPATSHYVADADGALTPILSQAAPTGSILRAILGVTAVAVTLCCVRLILRKSRVVKSP